MNRKTPDDPLALDTDRRRTRALDVRAMQAIHNAFVSGVEQGRTHGDSVDGGAAAGGFSAPATERAPLVANVAPNDANNAAAVTNVANVANEAAAVANEVAPEVLPGAVKPAAAEVRDWNLGREFVVPDEIRLPRATSAAPQCNARAFAELQEASAPREMAANAPVLAPVPDPGRSAPTLEIDYSPSTSARRHRMANVQRTARWLTAVCVVAGLGLALWAAFARGKRDPSVLASSATSGVMGASATTSAAEPAPAESGSVSRSISVPQSTVPTVPVGGASGPSPAPDPRGADSASDGPGTPSTTGIPSAPLAPSTTAAHPSAPPRNPVAPDKRPTQSPSPVNLPVGTGAGAAPPTPPPPTLTTPGPATASPKPTFTPPPGGTVDLPIQ